MGVWEEHDKRMREQEARFETHRAHQELVKAIFIQMCGNPALFEKENSTWDQQLAAAEHAASKFQAWQHAGTLDVLADERERREANDSPSDA